MGLLKQQRDELDARIAEMEADEVGIVISMDDAEREKQHQEDLQRLRGLRLIDDDFMNACFDGYIEGAELLLRIILNKQDIHVKKVTIQRRMKNLLGKDICLDIDADDDSGKEYNVEVQRSGKGADRKRARYHFSILDSHLLKPGDDFSDLPETKVLEDMRKESKWEQIVASVRRWLSMGLSHEKIAEGEGITLEQVREIAGMKRA